MTVEYTVKKSPYWLDIKYKFGATLAQQQLRVCREDISGLSSTEMFDGGMRLVPATVLYFDGQAHHVPVPISELVDEL